MPRTVAHEHVAIAAQEVTLAGDLVLPDPCRGVVVFAHGSGSSRSSPRNREVAGALHEGGFGTLLFDLLTPEEASIDEVTGHLRFDIDLLGDRMVGTVDWAARQDRLRGLVLGLFGASTGAAAALVAAAQRPEMVAAVVSRGGRPDLAGKWLRIVRAPTLLIVGGNDAPVIELNEQAATHIPAATELSIVPGADHLFTEPGKMQEVARLANRWFAMHLAGER